MIFPLHRATEAVPWEGTALRWWVLDALPSGDACDASPGPRPRNHLAPLVFSAARNYGDISIYIYLIWFKISNFQKIHENTVYPIDSYSISFKYCGWNMWIYDLYLCIYIYTHTYDGYMDGNMNMIIMIYMMEYGNIIPIHATDFSENWGWFGRYSKILVYK